MSAARLLRGLELYRLQSTFVSASSEDLCPAYYRMSFVTAALVAEVTIGCLDLEELCEAVQEVSCFASDISQQCYQLLNTRCCQTPICNMLIPLRALMSPPTGPCL